MFFSKQIYAGSKKKWITMTEWMPKVQKISAKKLKIEKVSLNSKKKLDISKNGIP